MAEFQRVEYRIGKDGNIVETVLNGTGESCVINTAPLEAALGIIESRELLPEHNLDGAESTLDSTLSQEL